jgi:hypothetical protein
MFLEGGDEDRGEIDMVTGGKIGQGTDAALSGRRRGRLHAYLGPAPGVGKTFAMLDEREPSRSFETPKWRGPFIEGDPGARRVRVRGRS